MGQQPQQQQQLPKPRNMNFVFARMHFIYPSNIFGKSAKDELYQNLLKIQGKDPLEIKRYFWAFGNIGQDKVDGVQVIYGRLGKTPKEKFDTFYDKDQHVYGKGIQPVPSSYISNFFILPSYDIIAFEKKWSISENQFIKYFTAIYKTIGSEIDFEFLVNKEDIFKIIDTWDRIIWAGFNLYPNPEDPGYHKELDEWVKETNAIKTKLLFDGAKRAKGLNKNSKFIKQGISMSSAGYGEYQLRGQKGNTIEKIGTKQTLITAQKHLPDDLNSIKEEIVREVLKRIGQRLIK